MFKKKISSKEINFYNLLQNNQNFDCILFPSKIEENTAYYPHLSSGNLLEKDKKYYILAMQAIAKFHHFIKSEQVSFITPDADWYARSLENTLKYADEQSVDLPKQKIEMLRKSLEMIKYSFQLIHGDFLPQNVMVYDEKVKIIDWENLMYGFAEHDAGRFLGDLHNENPRWNKKYYPLEWRVSLIDAYLQSRSKLDSKYDVQLGKQLIHLGEMWNYLGPIEMCLMRKDSTSDWFLQNLKALENC